ncbi:winged helix-turn-helix transcriptional regulator [Micromonospora echinofusca]|uniref:winged helix-turn-helix transcriptional regulator n=1 Tax=Micromonospora echinofusca TaxID=47858 RepID=UPI0027DC29EF|nr:helix-turn-helix domain-containing protein [Micromonospora echinofusca]
MEQPLDADLFANCRGDRPLIRIGGRWTGRILRCLRDGPRRFSELVPPLVGVTPKVLTESLRAMQRDGLVQRTDHGGMPPRVEYELTPLGRSLLAPMAVCCTWTEQHLTDIRDAREAYE